MVNSTSATPDAIPRCCPAVVVRHRRSPIRAPAPAAARPGVAARAPRRSHRVVAAARRSRNAAMTLVTRMAPLWRLAGNPQFDQSLEWIEASAEGGGRGHALRRRLPSPSQGWEMRDAALRLDGAGRRDRAVAASRTGCRWRSTRSRRRPAAPGPRSWTRRRAPSCGLRRAARERRGRAGRRPDRGRCGTRP